MSSAPSNEQIFKGIPVSKGIAIGSVHVVGRGLAPPEVYSISARSVPYEIERYTRAVEKTKRQLEKLRERVESLSGEEEGRIFEAHIMILEDRTVTSRVLKSIETRLQNAEYCFYAVIENALESMRRVADPFLRERSSDIEDVGQRVLRNFSSEEPTSNIEEPRILVSYDLNPSDTISMDRSKVLGFVTEAGSVNSHTAILARALGIPAIVGLDGAVLKFTTLAPAILDGYSGKIILYPSLETRKYYDRQMVERREARVALDTLRDKPSDTIDGRHITLSANIEFANELETVKENRAEGIGLFRTEFFLLEGAEPPSEKQQTETYRKVIQGVSPHGVIIRTLDAGGDKLPAEPLSEPEPNPFLGWRGIRVSLARRDFFKEQLRAILRASAHGKVGIMFPLVSGLSEVRIAREIVQECMGELDAAGEAFDPNIEVGAMIEVPSAAIMADEIGEHVDFFSFGTNDLIQYTIAVDRVNPRVADLYKPTHPAVIRLMKMTTDAGRKHKIWTGVCGEMAGDLRFTPILVGLGVDELSVGSNEIPGVRKAILSLDFGRCQEMVEEILTLSSSEQILQKSLQMANEAYPDLLI